MAGTIKGITIALDADTSAFNKALRSIQTESKKLQSELKSVNSALELDPKNNDLIKQKQDLLTKSIEETKKEEGCLIYEVFQTKSNPVEFIVIDSWESEEALNKHYETPHYSHFINNFNQYNAYIGPFELEIL